MDAPAAHSSSSTPSIPSSTPLSTVYPHAMSRRCRHPSPSSTISNSTTLVPTPSICPHHQRKPILAQTPKPPKPPASYTTLKPGDAGYAFKRGRQVHRPGVVVIKSFDEDGKLAVQEIELASRAAATKEDHVVHMHERAGALKLLSEKRATGDGAKGIQAVGKQACAVGQRRWSWNWTSWYFGDKNK